MMEIANSSQAYGDVVTEDGIGHAIWKCSVEDSDFFEKEFSKIPYTYIADGHHRAAAAYNVGKMRREKAKELGQEITGEEPFNFFYGHPLSLEFPENYGL